MNLDGHPKIRHQRKVTGHLPPSCTSKIVCKFAAVGQGTVKLLMLLLQRVPRLVSLNCSTTLDVTAGLQIIVEDGGREMLLVVTRMEIYYLMGI